MLELDHVFCFVPASGAWLDRLAAAGLHLDAGIEHPGQGTRNRRLPFDGQYLELVWLSSPEDAARNELRLDRRARWRETGASPIGIGLRGELPDAARADFALYQPPYAPGARIWVHRANHDAPARPFLFVMEAGPEELPRLAARMRPGANPGRVAGVTISGPFEPFALPASLPITQRLAERPRLELRVEGWPPLELDELVALA